MKKVFVDTNVFLRFFTKDEEGQHQRAVKLFGQAKEGELSLVTGPPVLFEIAWTLRSAYKQPKEKILSVLEAIIAVPGIEVTDKEIVGKAISIARNKEQEYADSYIVALAEDVGATGVATFNDRHFKKMGAVQHRF